MAFLEDLDPFLFLSTNLRNRILFFQEMLSELISRSMATTSCRENDYDSCRNKAAALRLKMVAIAAILVAGVSGIALPLLGKKSRILQTDGNLFVVAKAFAAGVILGTGFVHMLPDAASALTDDCLPESPWLKFPFAEFIAMLASLGTLVIEFVGTQVLERKNIEDRLREEVSNQPDSDRVESVESGIVAVGNGAKVYGAEEDGGMHIVGMHAHAAAHRHSHPHGHHSCEGAARKAGHVGHAHAAAWGGAEGQEGPSSHVRHVVVSQVLEMGIVSHSIIIGLSLGVSQSPCTIRPLMAALAFHQFFEGFALGGCISQAQFKTSSATLMACFFAITTPAGIGIGTAVSSSYNASSPRALVIEGILDSISAGILVYMALVDLIAADFLSRRMSCNVRLQVASYLSLFMGAGLMSALALWA